MSMLKSFTTYIKVNLTNAKIKQAHIQVVGFLICITCILMNCYQKLKIEIELTCLKYDYLQQVQKLL